MDGSANDAVQTWRGTRRLPWFVDGLRSDFFRAAEVTPEVRVACPSGAAMSEAASVLPNSAAGSRAS
jgi:hypothetical protein